MAVFDLLFLLVLASSATACDRCLHQSKVAFFAKADALLSGACGYADLAIGFNQGRLAAAASSIYRDGAACGACFKIRCRGEGVCSNEGTTVIVTDVNRDNGTDFVLSTRAFMGMANKGRGRDILKLGVVPVDYIRVPCDEYKKRNLGIRVEESSQKAQKYLAIKFLYQGGQTEIVAVDVAQVGSSNWNMMSRRSPSGAVWETNRVPNGALQFRFVVTAGYDGKWYWAKNVLPADWRTSLIYDSGLQISDVAQEGCSPCAAPWT